MADLLLPRIVSLRDKNRCAAILRRPSGAEEREAAPFLRRPSGAEEREAACCGRRGGGPASPAIKEPESLSNHCSGSQGANAAVEPGAPPAEKPAGNGGAREEPDGQEDQPEEEPRAAKHPAPAVPPREDRGPQAQEPVQRALREEKGEAKGREGASGLPPYEPFPIRFAGTPEEFQAPSADGILLKLLAEVLAREGPIHRDLVERRIAACFALPRIGKQATRRFEGIFARAEREGGLRMRGPFAWPSSLDPETWARVRGPDAKGEMREIEHMPPEELAAAAELVLRSSIALPRPHLAKAASQLLGWKRMTEKIERAIDAAVGLLAQKKRCVVEGDAVSLP